MKKAVFMGLAVMVFSGCSSFNREYKAALREPIPTTNISGPWEGRWLSDKNAHTGKLRAVLRQKTGEEYDAYFHSTFWKVFRASYRVPLQFSEENGRTILSGKADLGWLSGGVYTYEGEATPTNFFATYKMKFDHGTFEMKRPVPASEPQTEPPN